MALITYMAFFLWSGCYYAQRRDPLIIKKKKEGKDMALRGTLPPTMLLEMSSIWRGRRRELASYADCRSPPPPSVTSPSHRPSLLSARSSNVPWPLVASSKRAGAIGSPDWFPLPMEVAPSPRFMRERKIEGKRRHNKVILSTKLWKTNIGKILNMMIGRS